MLKKFFFIFFVLFTSPNAVASELDFGFSLYQSDNFTEAFPRLLALAKSGNPKAAGLVARMYIFGLGTQVDQSEAFRWGSEAAEKGDPLAQNLLGVLYKNGWGVNQNLENSIIWFRKSADQNFSFAFQNLGDAYTYGQGVTADRNEAVKWYELAASGDNAYALFMLSVSMDSIGEKSFNYLKASADKGFGDAMASLGDYYYNGTYVTKNYYEARKWYELASNTKSRHAGYAIYMLGKMAFWGDGELRNIKKGVELYQRASDVGNVYALNELGRIYQNGIEVDENQDLAFQYYLRSANLGNHIGQIEAAMHLMDGRGVKENKDKAKIYLELSARQNNLVARLSLIDFRITNEPAPRQLNKTLEALKFKALEHQKKFPLSEGYKAIASSDLTKRIQSALEMDMHVFSEKGIADNPEKKNKSKSLVNEINTLIRQEGENLAAREVYDFLTIKRYQLETSIWRGLWSSDIEVNAEAEKMSRNKLWEEINLFSQYLEKKYSPEHHFYSYLLGFKFGYLLHNRKIGLKTSLEQLLSEFSDSSIIVSTLAGNEITDDATCKVYLDHVEGLIGATMYVIPSGNIDVKGVKSKIYSITEKLEGADYCIDKKNLDSSLRLLQYLASRLDKDDNSLFVYLLKSTTPKDDLSTQADIAGLTGNFKKREKILRTLYAESGESGPNVKLLKYYFRDKEFDTAKLAIKKELQKNLKESFSVDEILHNISELPEVTESQKIFLLKKAIELDRKDSYQLAETWKSDEILGGYDWYNRTVERLLIEKLFDQKRNIEAELIIRFLKIKEISEFLRNGEEKNNFEFPDWFYTNQEKKINKIYHRYLDELIKNSQKPESSNPVLNNKFDKMPEKNFEKFFDFLISGQIPKSTQGLQKEIARIPDRIRLMVSSLPAKSALLQYIVIGDNLVINVNLRNQKLTKKISIKDQALETKIFLFRGAITSKANVFVQSNELYKILFQPIEADLIRSKITRLLISLDGKLRYIPFAALWDTKEFLIQKYSLSFFNEINDPSFDKISPQKIRVAGFGVTRNIGGFDALPGVQSELNQIVVNKSTGIFPGKIFLDGEFTLEQLRNSLDQRYPFFHIATHFRFSPGTEINSFLLLGDGSHLNLGILKTLDFNGVELVTYSGCQTGMGGGRDEDGKEIAGLSYITQKKGAKAVIASLWSVSDKGTAELMAKMYLAFSKYSTSISDALRKANIDLLKSSEFSHPFYWAGFQLYGNPR
jgi:CHAT domain-containing protein/TPR repeat protein